MGRNSQARINDRIVAREGDITANSSITKGIQPNRVMGTRNDMVLYLYPLMRPEGRFCATITKYRGTRPPTGRTAAAPRAYNAAPAGDPAHVRWSQKMSPGRTHP